MSLNRKSFLKNVSIGSLALVPGINYAKKGSAVHPHIKPAMLRPGDTIGMISPAGSLGDAQKYNTVVKNIEHLGFNVRVGRHAKDTFGYFAGTDKNRATDFNTMFANDEIDAILPFRGGWGSNRILDLIDFDLIKSNPKPLIGFSDITSLLMAIYAKTGLITFHGPVGKSEWTEFTRSYFRQSLMQNELFSMPSDDQIGDVTTIQPGRASGILMGGNLTVLTSMLGSDYLPSWQNGLLFLEDVGEDIYRIDRMLTQLKLNGVFDQINGLIFGKCTNCEISNGAHFTLEQILNHHLKEYEFPTFSGARIGHIKDMLTVPVGVHAKLDADKGLITLTESPVK